MNIYFIIAMALFLVAMILCGVTIYIMYKAIQKYMVDYETLSNNYDIDIAAYKAAYSDSVSILFGPLYQQLEAMKQADVSLIHESSVSQLYQNILNAHQASYSIADKYSKLVHGMSLPPYPIDEKHALESKFAHVRKTTEADFKKAIASGAQIIKLKAR